ncbi:hypothetical protein [Carnobacterium jeotgali]
MNTEDEKSHLLAVKIKEEQNYFITEIQKKDLELSNNKELSTTIAESLELNIDDLIGVADLMIERNQEATRDQLTYALLQSIASTSKTKQMRKIANNLLKKVGK